MHGMQLNITIPSIEILTNTANMRIMPHVFDKIQKLNMINVTYQNHIRNEKNYESLEKQISFIIIPLKKY